MSINELKTGHKAKIAEIRGGAGMAKKLENMGIRIGCEVTAVGSPAAHGPVIIQSGHTQVAIGGGMAKKILVEQQ